MQRDEFYDFMEGHYDKTELAAIQEFMDEEEFRLEMVRCASRFNQLAELLAEHHDPLAVTAALELVWREWDRAWGGAEDEA